MSRLPLIFFVLLTLGAALRADDVVFIVHPQTSAVSLSSDDVRAILVGNRTKWDSGGVIKLAVLTSGPAHERVMQLHAQRSADQFDKHWKKLVFTAKGVMPYQASDEAAMVEYVAKTPGALGYVSASAVNDKVKVVPIN